MKLTSLVVAVSVVLVFGAVGCKSAKQEAPAPASQAQAGDPLSGKVAETMNSGGYTYVCIESGGKKTWVAMPETAVKVGQEIACQPGGEMKNFTSKTLNRTFESVIFSPGVR